MAKYELQNFKIGDKVKVIKAGYGVAPENVGKITTIVGTSDSFCGRALISIEGFEKQWESQVGATSCAEHALQLATPAEKLGYKVGDKFLVHVRVDGTNGVFKPGDIVTLDTDDGSNSPNFKKDDVTLYISLRNVTPYVEPQKPVEVAVKPVIAYDVKVVAEGISQITVNVALTQDQIAAIIAIAYKQ